MLGAEVVGYSASAPFFNSQKGLTIMEMSLSDALLRRKELAAKVGVLKILQATLAQDEQSRRPQLTTPTIVRQPRHEGVDEVTVSVPTIEKEQVDKELNWHSSRMRKVDRAVQKANANTPVHLCASAVRGWDDDLPDDDVKVERALAELLDVRKSLNEAMGAASQIPGGKMVETKTAQKKATEGVQDMIDSVSKIPACELMKYFYTLQDQMRLVDSAIQATNNSTKVEVSDSLMGRYVPDIDISTTT